MRKKFYGMALAVVMAGAVSMMSGTVALANYNQKEAEESEASKDEVPQVVSEEILWNGFGGGDGWGGVYDEWNGGIGKLQSERG